MRILFHTHSRRAFTTTLIGNLHELTQEHDVILVSEPLSGTTLELLHQRSLFPRLECVVTIDPLDFKLLALIRANRKICRFIRELITKYRPDIVMSENDLMSLFDLYLLRLAKMHNLPTITCQAMADFKEADNRTYNRLMHLYPDGNPAGSITRGYRLARLWLRKYFGHLLVHTLLPWHAGLRTLHGKSSYIKWEGASGMRDGDLNLVLTPETFAEYARRGVPVEKLGLLRHPLERGLPRELFMGSATIDHIARNRAKPTFLVLMGFVLIGFERDSLTPISEDRRRAAFAGILALVRQILPDWRILLKPHPNWKTREKAIAFLDALDPSIEIIDPNEQVEPLMAGASAMLDLPPAASTTLFIALVAFPGKPVIAANVLNEFYGDNYRAVAGVDYVSGMVELQTLLQRINDRSYTKQPRATVPSPSIREFKSTNAAVSTLRPQPV